MQAVVFHEFGGPGVLQLANVPTPQPRPGEILIRILAAGLNRLEHYIRDGAYSRELALPHVLGSDAAGVVEAIGVGVQGFGLGERVIPMPGYPLVDEDRSYTPMSAAPSYAVAGVQQWGTYAQYIAVPAQWVLKDRTGLPPEQVATLPMVVATAVRAVRAVGELKPGQTILVHAGASGTGSMAIQVAKALGARVAATVNSPGKADFVRSLGAELVIDNSSQNFVTATNEWTDGDGVDVVLDNVGGDLLARSLDAVKRQGIVVAIGFVAGVEVRFDIRRFFFQQKQLRGSLMGSVEDLEWGLEQVRLGRIRPLLDRVLPLAQAAEAHRLLAEYQLRGNIVLDPWGTV